jgi:hypothetical protein
MPTTATTIATTIASQSFAQQVFEGVCAVFPSTTVRSFSKSLGRSAGYWSSIKAQGLALSNGALMNLSNTLETQILIAQHDATKKRMAQIQQQIAQELVRRFVAQVDADDAVLDELMELERTGKRSFSSSLPLPFILSSY